MMESGKDKSETFKIERGNLFWCDGQGEKDKNGIVLLLLLSTSNVFFLINDLKVILARSD